MTTITEAEAQRRELVVESEKLVVQIEAACSTQDAVLVASLRSDFNAKLADLEDLDHRIADYFARRDRKWRRMLRQAYGFVPGAD